VRCKIQRMAKKKKPGKFSVTKAVKSAARATVGSVRPTEKIPDAKSKQRQKATKHKASLQELIGDE
jgi:hypothetical protein